ncbi:MAG TPA: FAD-binding oxidoreductase [Acidimicrobiales bacterium]|nr:FAD-binding oxidoreductase [Acidimicrobiales bacterium]
MTVRALRSPSYRESVLWQEQAEFPDVPATTPPQSADCVVVGAGYAGLSCARDLARAGRSAVVLDAHAVGWGASSRNGGMVIPELKAGPTALERAYGPLGRRMYNEVNEAFDHVERLITVESIDCDYGRTGQLFLAHAVRVVPSLMAMAREHGDELGEPVRFVPRDELGDEVGSTVYAAGLVMERTGGLHPARFHAGLLRLALAAGASVHAATPATAIERRGGGRAGFRVTTPRGTVDVATVVVCTNAYADGLLPELRRRVLPVGSFIIATEVLEPDLARSVSPRGRMLVDSKNFLFYWRLTPDRRLVFGGRRSLASSTIAQARDFLYASMLRVHPQLEGTRIDRVWGGNVAVTLDRLPHVGRLDGAWYVTGCNGSGVALNSWLGARMARHLVGDAAPPSFAELQHRPIPLDRARAAYLPLVGLWFRWQDRGFAT